MDNFGFNNQYLLQRIEIVVGLINDAIANEPALHEYRRHGFVVSNNDILNKNGELHNIYQQIRANYSAGAKTEAVDTLLKMYDNVFHVAIHPETPHYSQQGAPEDWLLSGMISQKLPALRQMVLGNSDISVKIPAGATGGGFRASGGAAGSVGGAVAGMESVAKEAENAEHEAAKAESKMGAVEGEEKRIERGEENLQGEVKKVEYEIKSVEEQLDDLSKKEIREGKHKSMLKSDRVGFSLNAGRLATQLHFDMFLTLIGILFGGYLTLTGYVVLGIPLLIGGFVIGLRAGYFSNLLGSLLRPAGDFAMSSIPLSIIIFVAGAYIVKFVTSVAQIAEFDTFQFGLIAFGNTLLLTFLWLGVKGKVETSSPVVFLQNSSPGAVGGAGAVGTQGGQQANKAGGKCDACGGAGHIGNNKCMKCNGSGTISSGSMREGRSTGGEIKPSYDAPNGVGGFFNQMDTAAGEKGQWDDIKKIENMEERMEAIDKKRHRESERAMNTQESQEKKMESAFTGFENMEKHAEEEHQAEQKKIEEELMRLREEERKQKEIDAKVRSRNVNAQG